MARLKKRQLIIGFLSIVWLAVVGFAVYLAVTRYDVYGYVAFLVPAIALFMLIIFALAFLPQKAGETPLGKRLGHLATGALILLALLVLGIELIRQWRVTFNTLVIGLFFVVFLGIFRDWLRAFMDPKKRTGKRGNG